MESDGAALSTKKAAPHKGINSIFRNRDLPFKKLISDYLYIFKHKRIITQS